MCEDDAQLLADDFILQRKKRSCAVGVPGWYKPGCHYRHLGKRSPDIQFALTCSMSPMLSAYEIYIKHFPIAP